MYPVEITRADLLAHNACHEGVEAFDKHVPYGVLHVPDVIAHVALLAGPLAPHEVWAVSRGFLPPLAVAGGDRTALTGGYRSTLTGGDYSIVTGGYRSTVTGGHDSTVTGGGRSTVTGGDRSTVTGGYRSTVTGGHDSTVTGGHDSTLMGGHDSTVTGGHDSTLTGGPGSTLAGGPGSVLTWRRYDGRRYRLTTVYVGEDGVEAGTPYRLVDGVPTRAEQ